MTIKFSAHTTEKVWKKFWRRVYSCEDIINDQPFYELVWEQMSYLEREEACRYFPSKYLPLARGYLFGRLDFWKENIPTLRHFLQNEYNENIDPDLDDLD